MDPSNSSPHTPNASSSAATHTSQIPHTNPFVQQNLFPNNFQIQNHFPSPTVHQPLTTLGQPLTITLDRDNYLLWKIQLLNVILANGLEEFIDGTRPQPPRFLDQQQLMVNPDFRTWQRYNNLLMSWFYSSLSESMVSQIVGHQTTFEIWSTIERTYSANSKSRLLELRTEIPSLKKNGLTANKYIYKLKSLSNKLASIGEPVCTRDLMIYFAQGLGPEYNSFILTINAMPVMPTIEEIHILLLDFDLRLQRQTAADQVNLPLASVAAIPNMLGMVLKNM